MAHNAFYPEEYLIEKMEKGEYGWLDYVNHHSAEWQEEYEDYCRTNGISISEQSAESFVHFKNIQLEEAIERGDA